MFSQFQVKLNSSKVLFTLDKGTKTWSNICHDVVVFFFITRHLNGEILGSVPGHFDKRFRSSNQCTFISKIISVALWVVCATSALES